LKQADQSFILGVLFLIANTTEAKVLHAAVFGSFHPARHAVAGAVAIVTQK
jgi:hypothetical protein